MVTSSPSSWTIKAQDLVRFSLCLLLTFGKLLLKARVKERFTGRHPPKYCESDPRHSATVGRILDWHWIRMCGLIKFNQILRSSSAAKDI